MWHILLLLLLLLLLYSIQQVGTQTRVDSWVQNSSSSCNMYAEGTTSEELVAEYKIIIIQVVGRQKQTQLNIR